MNDEISTALTVYVPPQSRMHPLVRFVRLLNRIVSTYFLRVRFLLFVFLSAQIFIFYLIYGMALDDFAVFKIFPYVFSTLCGKICFIITSIFLLLSGLTIFGKFIYVLYFLVMSAGLASLLPNFLLSFHASSPISILKIFIIAIVAFVVTAVSVFGFHYSKRAYLGVRAIFAVKSVISYFVFNLFSFLALYLLINFL